LSLLVCDSIPFLSLPPFLAVSILSLLYPPRRTLLGHFLQELAVIASSI
jgi:hypothetical protein